MFQKLSNRICIMFHIWSYSQCFLIWRNVVCILATYNLTFGSVIMTAMWLFLEGKCNLLDVALNPLHKPFFKSFLRLNLGLRTHDVLTLIGMRQGGFTPLIILGSDFVSWFFIKDFQTFGEVKIEINHDNLTPCQAHWTFYSATSFLEKWFLKSGSSNSDFFSGQPLFSNLKKCGFIE